MKTVPALRREIVEAVRGARSGPDLHRFLQSAIELEHATIPPYLTALYSIVPGANLAAAEILRSIVRQEMLHMTIAANVLNALGGAPRIDSPAFVPCYPGPLPMSVDDGLVVPLAPLSLDLVETVFMRIELPETPQHYPDLALAAQDRGYSTIGEFYDAIIERIEALGDPIFARPSHPQVVDAAWFPPDQLFAVTGAASAVCALQLIKRQGEGSAADPLDARWQPAHYYRFEEILRGRRLVKDPTVPQGYSFSGAPVPFDPAGVLPLVTNSRRADYAPGSLAADGVGEADYSYTCLLNALHQTFNGAPERLRAAMGLMIELRLLVLERVVTQQLTAGPNAGKYAAPSFQFAPAAAMRPAAAAAE
jgi:hypothetical protein